ncbi:MAG: 4-alpha-glucanotransferase, partial [Lachnospiraceae bacterium]|nr:4-alpha-glucanotransferase [Lachnospiraceae bacterium]
FAGNPYFISLDALIEEGLLKKSECDELYFGTNPEYVDYGALYESRFKALYIAYERFKDISDEDESYAAFLEKEAYWLDDYCMFMAFKELNGWKGWTEWEEPLRNRDKKAMAKAAEECADEIGFYRFQQYKFMEHWEKVHAYAGRHGVSIIGDIPIYVAFDSADTWSHPEMFQFDRKNVPLAVAGCPPDAFSETGQLWGNPLYNWKYLKKHGYEWWIRRIARCLEFYDVIRIDHFRGFDEYYAVPYGEETAMNGKWEKGPGMDLFNAIREKLGEVEIIAEDLGYITESVRKLLSDSGFPGMKILQFAFDESENSLYLTHEHIKNCVVYTGTHDNMTSRGWIDSLNDHDRDFVRNYINSIHTDYGQFTWDFIREAFRSVSDLCIVPIQDFLVKGNEARINIPAVGTGNWQWRVAPNTLSEDLARSILRMTKLYGRYQYVEIQPEEEPEKEAGETAEAEGKTEKTAEEEA